MTIKLAAVAAAFGRFRADAPSVEEPAELREKIAALLQASFRDDPSLVQAMELLSSLFDDADIDLATMDMEYHDRLYVTNLLRLKPTVVSAGRMRPRGLPIQFSEAAEDCLADNQNDWSVFKVLNLALMASVPPRQSVAIVTSVRNEGLSILEWLAHHRASGIEHFFVYTNDNTDASGDLLRALANFGIINLIENNVGPNVRIQGKILDHSLHLLPELRDFEWAFFIDVDEFFISKCEPDVNVTSFFKEFARTFSAMSPSAICLNWKWFGSENAFEPTSGLLLERFVYSIENEHVKPLVRLRDVVSMHRVHAPVLREGAWIVNSEFSAVEPTLTMKPSYDKAQLNHYWNKSFKEFVLKRARGRISRGLASEPLDFTSFFDWGANGRRGNLDMPDERTLERLKLEYHNLLSIPGIDTHLAAVKEHSQANLERLSREIDIAGLYQRRGRDIPPL